MYRAAIFFALALVLIPAWSNAQDNGWKKHVVHEGVQTMTAVAGDFTASLPGVLLHDKNGAGWW